MRKQIAMLALGFGVLATTDALAAEAAKPVSTNEVGWLTQPLSVADALNMAERQNGAIQKAKKELEASQGVVIQTRAIAIPKLQSAGSYRVVDQGAIESIPFPGSPKPNDQNWSATIHLVQSIYEGGRITSSLRTARLTREQSLLQYQTVLADTLLEVRTAYYDVLLAEQQIKVQQASVELLAHELEDTKRRQEAGTVPQFNVLRAEVEVANARPRLIRAQNSFRTGKQRLVYLMGFSVPANLSEDLPLQLTGQLEEQPYDLELSKAVSLAFERRSELAALRKAEQLRAEAVVNAKSGYKPSLQAFGGYESRNTQFSRDIGRDVSGWVVGAQMNWNIFDGFQTRGRVLEAKARQDQAKIDIDDRSRAIDLEVRTAYSNFVEAKEVLASQKKVQEQAQEAVRLATARSQAGTGTQLDVLSAQTALTEARTTQILALRDYSVALARLERAIGQTETQKAK